MPEVRRHGSARGGGGGATRSASNSSQRPLELALGGQFGLQLVAQRDQQLDVQRRVVQPVLRQRPARPVGGAVALLQPVAEQQLDERAERDPLEAGEAAGELGVEQPRRAQAQLGEAGEVLGGGVQHPFGVGERGDEGVDVVVQRDGVDRTVPAPSRRSCTR